MKLTEEQRLVIKGIIDGFKAGKRVIAVGGAAGTGKTTLISNLIKVLPNWAVCAYTGKAAEVLRRKGVDASTIHSLIYTPAMSSDGSIFRDKSGNPIFHLADSLPYSGLIIDEASMVGKDIHKDLLSFDTKILYVGDHAQLEPIASDINIMAHPDFVLETIHRNAGEIAHFCQWIRSGYNPVAFANHYSVKKVKFINQWQADSHLMQADQVICAYNKTRVQLNALIRYGKGFKTNKPESNDRIMCLKNNRQIGLFNGMQGEIEFLYNKENRMRFKTEDRLFDIHYDPYQFGRESYSLEDYGKDDPMPFDWCYAITCHKAQGSEWDKVMVYAQRSNRWDMRRWNYTAASRAKKSLVWVVGM